MKSFLRKALSIMLTLAILVMPLSVFAEELPLGDMENPYQLSTNDVRFAVTVEAGATAWVQVDDCNNSTLTVGYATGSGYMIQYGRMNQYYPEGTDNTLSFTMQTGGDMFLIMNTGEEQVVIYMSLTAGEAVDNTGTMENPKEIAISANMFGGVGGSDSAELAAGNQGYYFTCTAPADGELVVSIGAIDADWNYIGWMYFVNNITAGKYGDNHFSDDEVVVNPEEIEVSAGDEIVIFATTYDPADMWNAPAGTVSVDISFNAVGSWGNPEIIEEAGNFSTAGVSNGHYYNYAAPGDGEVTVTILTETGWTYVVNNTTSSAYGDTQWSDSDPVVPSQTVQVSEGDVLEIMINTYDPADPWAVVEGEIEWSLTFAPAGGNEGGEDPVDPPVEPPVDPEVNYEISEIPLVVGTNDYTVSNMYTYTVYIFTPDAEGKYTFSSENSMLGIVSYQDMWVQFEPNAEIVNANSFEWECTGVGQAIMVAVLADTNVGTITIEHEEVIKEEIEWTIYENVVTPEDFTFEGDADALLYVDTFDEIVDTAVLGEDGFYHLNSVDGPILYANLNDTLMSLVSAYGYGQLKDIIYDEEGNVIAKVDYNTAFEAYMNCADADTYLYPLTVDLVEMFTKVGEEQGWYGEEGWVGGDLEDAWMFACYYSDAPEYVLGDADGNGELTATDYMIIKQLVFSMRSVEDLKDQETAALRCDMNGDGKYTAADYLMVKKAIFA